MKRCSSAGLDDEVDDGAGVRVETVKGAVSEQGILNPGGVEGVTFTCLAAFDVDLLDDVAGLDLVGLGHGFEDGGEAPEVPVGGFDLDFAFGGQIVPVVAQSEDVGGCGSGSRPRDRDR